MKNFYEMWRLLEGRGPYDDAPVSFTRVLGEDGDAPFSIEVDYYDGEWEPRGSLFVRRENPGEGGKWDEYRNPGKDFGNVPEPVRSRALAWAVAELERHVANYRPEDPRGDEEPRGRAWDDGDQDNYDRKLWLGGEKW